MPCILETVLPNLRNSVQFTSPPPPLCWKEFAIGVWRGVVPDQVWDEGCCAIPQVLLSQQEGYKRTSKKIQRIDLKGT